jgi:hypothetical protein
VTKRREYLGMLVSSGTNRVRRRSNSSQDIEFVLALEDGSHSQSLSGLQMN